MGSRRRPATITFRGTWVDHGLVETAARARELSVSEYLHRLVMPAVRTQVAGLALAGTIGQHESLPTNETPADGSRPIGRGKLSRGCHPAA